MNGVLVTGGAGFIGSCLIRQLVDLSNTEVVNLDKLTYAGNLDSLRSIDNRPNYRFVQGDIGDGELVIRLLHDCQPSTVINLAAESHVDRSIDGPAVFLQTNVLGTFQLLQSVLEYWRSLPEQQAEGFRFLHVSTDEVYGSLGSSGRFTEESRYAPNSPYAASKASSDHFVRAFFQTYRLPVLTTNCSNNYGSFQFPEKLIPLMIQKAMASKPLPIYGDGQQVRDWLHVEDHCRALQVVLNRGTPGEVYHIGGDNEKTNLEIVQQICDLVDQRMPQQRAQSARKLIEFVVDRPGHDRRYAMDCSRIQTELGWQPQIDFESGLESTVEWYLENSEWVERVTSGKYRLERLGLDPEETNDF